MILVQRLPTEPTLSGKYRKSLGLFKCLVCGKVVKRELSTGYRANSCCYTTPSDYNLLGETKTRLCRIFKAMIARCYRDKTDAYPYYGGRGITVCSDWRWDYQAFKHWALANGYADDLEIDRIDSQGNYCPENCRWTTRLVNIRNCSHTKLTESDIPVIRSMIGMGTALSSIARDFGVSYDAILRIKNGLTWKDIPSSVLNTQ